MLSLAWDSVSLRLICEFTSQSFVDYTKKILLITHSIRWVIRNINVSMAGPLVIFRGDHWPAQFLSVEHGSIFQRSPQCSSWQWHRAGRDFSLDHLEHTDVVFCVVKVHMENIRSIFFMQLHFIGVIMHCFTYWTWSWGIYENLQYCITIQISVR
jgi:hypothetical protein